MVNKLSRQAEQIKQLLQQLFAEQRLAVLATQQAEKPYASLVAFVAEPDLRHIYFATPRSTRKFENLSANPNVALLINSSMNDPSDFHRAVAVTAQGRVSQMADHQKKEMQRLYSDKHPYLIDFVRSPTCALLCVRVRSYFLVKNFQHVMEYHFEDDLA